MKCTFRKKKWIGILTHVVMAHAHTPDLVDRYFDALAPIYAEIASLDDEGLGRTELLAKHGFHGGAFPGFSMDLLV